VCAVVQVPPAGRPDGRRRDAVRAGGGGVRGTSPTGSATGSGDRSDGAAQVGRGPSRVDRRGPAGPRHPGAPLGSPGDRHPLSLGRYDLSGCALSALPRPPPPLGCRRPELAGQRSARRRNGSRSAGSPAGRGVLGRRHRWRRHDLTLLSAGAGPPRQSSPPPVSRTSAPRHWTAHSPGTSSRSWGNRSAPRIRRPATMPPCSTWLARCRAARPISASARDRGRRCLPLQVGAGARDPQPSSSPHRGNRFSAVVSAISECG